MAKKYKVYAVDLLGFGWSDKALIEYDALVWRDQVVDFLKEIVKEPAILVGNRQVIVNQLTIILSMHVVICASSMDGDSNLELPIQFVMFMG